MNTVKFKDGYIIVKMGTKEYTVNEKEMIFSMFEKIITDFIYESPEVLKVDGRLSFTLKKAHIIMEPVKDLIIPSTNTSINYIDETINILSNLVFLPLQSDEFIKQETINVNEKLISLVKRTTLILAAAGIITMPSGKSINDLPPLALKSELDPKVHTSQTYNHFNVETVHKMVPNEIYKTTFDEKLTQILNNDYSNENFNPGSRLNSDITTMMKSFIEGPIGEHLINESSKYGIDPYLMLAILYGESTLGANDTLDGIAEVNSIHVGNTYSAFNYETNQRESITVTNEMRLDDYSGITVGMILLQNNLEYYNNNIFMAINAYNTGPAGVNLAIAQYSIETGLSKEDIINNQTDMGWVKYVTAMNLDPQGEYQRLSAAGYDKLGCSFGFLASFQGRYATAGYLAITVGNCPTDMILLNTSEGVVLVNLATGEKIPGMVEKIVKEIKEPIISK